MDQSFQLRGGGWMQLSGDSVQQKRPPAGGLSQNSKQLIAPLPPGPGAESRQRLPPQLRSGFCDES